MRRINKVFAIGDMRVAAVVDCFPAQGDAPPRAEIVWAEADGLDVLDTLTDDQARHIERAALAEAARMDEAAREAHFERVASKRREK